MPAPRLQPGSGLAGALHGRDLLLDALPLGHEAAELLLQLAGGGHYGFFRDELYCVACGEHLVQKGYAHRKRLFGLGGSAGGLLMGAVANMRPELFCGIIAHVPFVDVVTTMLDDTLPLTTGEYDEWGDPRRREYHDYILSYSPYDNVEAKAYPHLLVTTGLHDSQVQYWEPAKWVARLRATRTNDARLLLRTSMGAGHQGPSGRYRTYREIALDYAFLLDLAGVAG